MDVVYKWTVIATGIIMLILDLRDITKKKMDIGIGSWWAVLALIVIVFGIVFDFSSLRSFIRCRNLALIYLFCVAMLTALYLYGLSLTKLKKEYAEIVMWVSYAKAVEEGRAESADAGAGTEKEGVTP